MVLLYKMAALPLTVKLTDLRWFDGYERAWKLDKGDYVISAAASSQDIRQTVILIPDNIRISPQSFEFCGLVL